MNYKAVSSLSSQNVAMQFLSKQMAPNKFCWVTEVGVSETNYYFDT